MINYRLIVPLLGKGSRFADEGFSMPKPLILVDDKTIIEHSMSSFDIRENCELIFLVRSEHVTNFSMDRFLKQKFGERTVVVSVNGDTRGSVESVLKAEHLINDDIPLAIWCSDVFFGDGGVIPGPDEINGCLNYVYTTTANSPAYSYIKTDEDGFVTEVAEKMVISNKANLGYYAFESGKVFIHYAKKMIHDGTKTNGEFYLAPLYNLLISDGFKVTYRDFEKSHFFGNPRELKFYKECVLNKFRDSKCIAIASDHSGYELKEELKDVLTSQGFKFVDCGAFSDSPSDYATYSKILVEQIGNGNCSHGFLICRSANGQAIYANKYKHIRCAYVFDEWTAKHSIEHNCANVFALPSKYVNNEMLEIILNRLKESTFQGGRHEDRMRRILDV